MPAKRGIEALRKRSEYALKYMLRRRAQVKKFEAKREYKNYQLEVVELQKSEHAARKLAAQQRREDYRLGPLAPWRAYDEDEPLAAISVRRTQFPTVPEERRRTPWLANGDRVLLLKGPDKGQIGTVTLLAETTETIKVKGLNMVCDQTGTDVAI